MYDLSYINMDNKEKIKTTEISADSLEEMTGMEYNNRIVSFGLFLCKRCYGLIQSPVILIEHEGNICRACVRPNDTIIRNVALEIILENVVLSCENFENGCNEKLRYPELLKHQSKCNYRNYECPARLLKCCIWEGDLPALVIHMTTRHQLRAVLGRNNSFKFEINLIHNENIIKLLYTDDQYFLLHIKMHLTVNKLYYMIYHMGKKESSHVLYTVTQIHEDNTSSFSYKTVSYQDYYLQDADLKKAVDLPDALYISKPIIIKLTLNTPEKLNNKLLESFECFFCNDYMKPPIYQCQVGHSVCNICISRLDQCPICNATFAGTRNFTLESLCEDTRFPCCYRENGCLITLLVEEIKIHEDTCSYKPYNCPFSDKCHWRNIYSEIESHLNFVHKNELTFGNYMELCIKMPIDTIDTYTHCMIVYDAIFLIYVKEKEENQSICWFAKTFKSRSKQSMYKYEIGLINSQDKNKRYIKSDSCRTSNVFKKPITFSHDDIVTFSVNSTITYYCKITKVRV